MHQIASGPEGRHPAEVEYRRTYMRRRSQWQLVSALFTPRVVVDAGAAIRPSDFHICPALDTASFEIRRAHDPDAPSGRRHHRPRRVDLAVGNGHRPLDSQARIQGDALSRTA